jgi:hypothetical protein
LHFKKGTITSVPLSLKYLCNTHDLTRELVSILSEKDLSNSSLGAEP